MGAPVGYTCSDIDRIIKHIKAAEELCSENPDDIDGYKDVLSDIESELWSLDTDMEDIRSANEQLRAWGEDLETELNELNEEQ